jgi:AraC-like DNA-binding protein
MRRPGRPPGHPGTGSAARTRRRTTTSPKAHACPGPRRPPGVATRNRPPEKGRQGTSHSGERPYRTFRMPKMVTSYAKSSPAMRSRHRLCEVRPGYRARPAVGAGVSAATHRHRLALAPEQIGPVRVRLDHAHRDLLAASPASTTVTAIAARWGFASPSRFSDFYRRAYGRLPGHTLRHAGLRPLRGLRGRVAERPGRDSGRHVASPASRAHGGWSASAAGRWCWHPRSPPWHSG